MTWMNPFTASESDTAERENGQLREDTDPNHLTTGQAEEKASAKKRMSGGKGGGDPENERHSSQKPGQGPVLKRRELGRCAHETRESQLKSKMRRPLKPFMSTTLEVWTRVRARERGWRSEVSSRDVALWGNLSMKRRKLLNKFEAQNQNFNLHCQSGHRGVELLPVLPGFAVALP